MAYTKWFALWCFVTLLVACGDGDKNMGPLVAPSSELESDMVVSTKADLPKCTDKSDGAIAYVKDEKSAYICNEGRWTRETGKQQSSSSKAKSSSSNKSSSSSSKFEVRNKTFYGFAQKGPFYEESVVNIYELDEKTLAKTGEVFSEKVVVGSTGKFKVPHVNLSSPYALFEVSGRFRNEVTAARSKKSITLYALVDISDRKDVNINVFTHLAYGRTLYLFKKGMDFAEAKKQAESEILKAFAFHGEFAGSEDMNIFSYNEDGFALLALSMLVLGYGEANLADFLDDFAADFNEDGKWDDETVKAKIADWANGEGLVKEYSSLHGNIMYWWFEDDPKFDKYLTSFWTSVYGLGACGDDEEGEIVENKNEKSSNYGNGIRFLCTKGAWREASPPPGTYGREAYCGECTEKREGDFCNEALKTWGWLGCSNGEWIQVSWEYVDTRGWTAGTDGELRKGDTTDRFYFYDEIMGEWILAEKDSALKIGGCTVKRDGEIAKSPKDDTYYICEYFPADFDAMAHCKWRTARELDFVKRDEKCASEDVGRIVYRGEGDTLRFYCTANGWADMMNWDYGVPKEYRFNPDIDYGSLTDNRDGKTYRTVKIGDQTWMAENLNYAGDGIGHCYNDVPENCEVGGRFYKWDVAREVCPAGWHLPSKEEFDALLSAVEHMYDGEGYSLADIFKTTSGWANYYWQKSGQGLDKVGFSAVPAGGKYILSYRMPDYTLSGDGAFFLSSTEYNKKGVYVMMVSSDEASVAYEYSEDLIPYYGTKTSELSVRCLQDSE